MRIKLTLATRKEEVPYYLETNNISDMSREDNVTTVMMEYGESVSVKETPEEIEKLERQAIIERDKVIQAEKAKAWSEQLFEQVESSNANTLEQVRSINKVLNTKIAEMEKRLKKLEK